MHISVCKKIHCTFLIWYWNQQAFLEEPNSKYLDFEGHNIMLGAFETFISSFASFYLPVILENSVLHKFKARLGILCTFK